LPSFLIELKTQRGLSPHKYCPEWANKKPHSKTYFKAGFVLLCTISFKTYMN